MSSPCAMGLPPGGRQCACCIPVIAFPIHMLSLAMTMHLSCQHHSQRQRLLLFFLFLELTGLPATLRCFSVSAIRHDYSSFRRYLFLYGQVLQLICPSPSYWTYSMELMTPRERSSSPSRLAISVWQFRLSITGSWQNALRPSFASIC